VGDECDENQQSEISFQNMWSSQVFEKKRMTLEESHDRVDQLCKQYCENEDCDDRSSNVNDSEHNHNKQDCKKFAYCGTIGECHMASASDKRRPEN
jgi:hypothetical protein